MLYINVANQPNLSITSNEWYTIDNLILVNFTSTYPTTADIDSFMNK